jgi:hypothetical protein
VSEELCVTCGFYGHTANDPDRPSWCKKIASLGDASGIDSERLDAALIAMGLDWGPAKRADFIAFYEDTDDD